MNLPSLKVKRLKRAKIYIRKVAKIYSRCMVGGKFVPSPYKLLENIATLRGYIFVSFQQINFELGYFINLKALFSAK